MAKIKTTNIRDDLRLIEGFRGYDRDTQTSNPGQNGQVFAKQNGRPAWVNAPPAITQRYISTNGIGIQDISSTDGNPNTNVDIDQTLITSGTSDFTVSGEGAITVINAGIYIAAYSFTFKHNLAGDRLENNQDENMIIGQCGIEVNNVNVVETIGRGTSYARTGGAIYDNGFLTLSGDTVLNLAANDEVTLVGGIRDSDGEASVLVVYLDYCGLTLYTVN